MFGAHVLGHSPNARCTVWGCGGGGDRRRSGTSFGERRGVRGRRRRAHLEFGRSDHKVDPNAPPVWGALGSMPNGVGGPEGPGPRGSPAWSQSKCCRSAVASATKAACPLRHREHLGLAGEDLLGENAMDFVLDVRAGVAQYGELVVAGGLPRSPVFVRLDRHLPGRGTQYPSGVMGM